MADVPDAQSRSKYTYYYKVRASVSYEVGL